jgi:RHS repeat-associated protein
VKEQCQRERGGGSRRRPAVHYENRRRRVGGLDRSNATCPAGVRPRKAGPNQYDAFGNITISSGSHATSFTYRFSTKPRDSITGLYYYGYRWYDPLTGRWPSRDPIEEAGGVNLYGFVANYGVNGIDLYGLARERQDCERQTIGIRLKDLEIDPRGAGFFGVAGRVSLGFRGSRTKCCKVCDDGSVKSTFSFQGIISLDSIVEITGGPQFNAVWGGWGVRGRVGAYGSIEARAQFGGGWTWDQCERKLSLNIGGGIFAEAKLGVGFQGSLVLGGRAIEATGFFGGYARLNIRKDLVCNEKSCNFKAIQETGEAGISGQVSAQFWGKSWSYRHDFGTMEFGSNQTLVDKDFATPGEMKP